MPTDQGVLMASAGSAFDDNLSGLAKSAQAAAAAAAAQQQQLPPPPATSSSNRSASPIRDCEVTTIELPWKPNSSLGISFVGGSDTPLVSTLLIQVVVEQN